MNDDTPDVDAQTADTRSVIPRLSILRPTWLDSLVVYAVLIGLAATYGYWAILTSFATYDDEGFFDFTVRLFLHGHALYTTVWTTYGPFYYEVMGALFKVLGSQPTTDSGRIVTLTLWVLSSLLLGLAAQRLTRRLSIGAATFATSFYMLRALTDEPMHTQGLICVLLALLAVVVAFALPIWHRSSLVAIGAICGALLLSKINVGGFAAVSIAFAAATTGQSILRRRIFTWLTTALFVLIGPLIMIHNLNGGTTQIYAVVVILSTLAIAFVAIPERVEVAVSDDAWSWIGWLVGGAVGLAVVVIVVLMALGTSFGDFIEMVIIEPTKQADFLTIPATFNADAVAWSAAAGAAAWALRAAGWLSHPPQTTAVRVGSGIARLLAALAILLSLSNLYPFGIGANAPFALAMPLAFLAAIPPFGAVEAPPRRFARVLIPSLAVLQCLLAYPVAGSQVYLGGILLFACGAVCLGDGMAELETSERMCRVRAGITGVLSIPRVATGLFVALGVGTSYLLLANQGEAAHNDYRAQTSVPIPGATHLHLAAANAEQYAQMYMVLRSRCSTLISLPALYSFNNWTGLPWPNAIGGAQPYWIELSASQQQQTLQAARRSPRLCVIRNLSDAAGYGATMKQTPLVRYLEGSNFRVILNSAPYSIAVGGG